MSLIVLTLQKNLAKYECQNGKKEGRRNLLGHPEGKKRDANKEVVGRN